MKTCPKCNNTFLQQCTPDCPQTIHDGEGRGWHCDVDARYENGCPPCECVVKEEDENKKTNN